jgi:kumamolisin
MPKSIRFATQPRVVLPGSEKQALTRSTLARPGCGLQTSAARTLMAKTVFEEPKPATGKVTVTAVVRRKQSIDESKLGTPGYRLTHAEYARRHGPDSASLKIVKAFAREFGLSFAATAPGRAAVHLTGTVAAMRAAFGVTLQQQKVGGKNFRVRQGTITLPRELSAHIVAVLGLDDRPQAEPHFRCLASSSPHAHAFNPIEIARLYDFPANATAAGQTIGILEFGGGLRRDDLATYFRKLGVPAPEVVIVPVGKGKNAPTGRPGGNDGEVMMDIEVAAAVAPGVRIAVYFAENTDRGFLEGIATAIHDKVNRPSVLSVSWGGAESTWTRQSMVSIDAVCQTAAAFGVSITVAVGDNGSTDGVKGAANHADFPSSSPHVLACGGTRLTVSGTTTDEVVWNGLRKDNGATGGGVSREFPLPRWQKGENVPASTSPRGGRGIPDVAGDADPMTGYRVRYDGGNYTVGGTSAVAPLWAGLIALSNAQHAFSAGFLNPVLYAAESRKALRDITSGNNGGFAAEVGWDACTGLGSPIGAAIIAALGHSAESAKPGKKKHKQK